MSKVLTHISDQWDLETVSKSAYKLLNLRAAKQTAVNKIYIFQCMGKIFVWKFKWHSHSLKTVWFICNTEISRALRFKSSYTFWIPNIQHGNRNKFARWFHQSTLGQYCMQILNQIQMTEFRYIRWASRSTDEVHGTFNFSQHLFSKELQQKAQ